MSIGSSGPSASESASAQAAANQQAMLQSLLGSQVDQETPWGSMRWSGSIPIVDPQTGKVTSYVNMPTAEQFQGQQGAPQQGAVPQSAPTQGGWGEIPGSRVNETLPGYGPLEGTPGQAGGMNGGAGAGAGGGMSGASGYQGPRTMTVSLSPHGQYMQGGTENIAKALLDRASRTATQVQGQQAFDIGAMGLPPQVGGLGLSSMLSKFSPVGAAGMSGGVSELARALMRGRR